MERPCSGVILAGGLSSRFNGKNKAFFQMGGRPIIQHIIDVFETIFEDILIVTNDPIPYLPWDVTLVSDIHRERSSLTGIHAGLFYAANPYIFVTACDTPFISRQMVELVISRIKPGVAAVMPETPAGIEPLFAAYSVDVLPAVLENLKEGKYKIRRVFSRRRVVKIPVAEILKNDPDLLNFVNINTEADLNRAKAFAPESE